MAVGTFQLFDSTAKLTMGAGDLVANTIKCALVTSSWTPDQVNNNDWGDVSANEIANGFGYATGGATLGSKVLTAVTKGFKFSSANIQWTASGGSIPAWRYAVFYVVGTIDSVVNPLIGYFIGNDAPADIPATIDGSPLNLNCPAGGWFTTTRP